MNKLKLLAQTAVVAAVLFITPPASAHEGEPAQSAGHEGRLMQSDMSSGSGAAVSSEPNTTTRTMGGTDASSMQTMSDSGAMMQMQPAGDGNGVQTTATAAQGNFDATAEAAPAAEPTADRSTLWGFVVGLVAGSVVLAIVLLVLRRRRA